MIYLHLIWSFMQVGMFSIGGGYAAMPLIQNEVVQAHQWLTLTEFTDLVTIAEMTPGPIAVNAATFVGIRIAGLAGAAAATFGCILPSCVLVSLLYLLYQRFRSMQLLQSVLGMLRTVVVGLIAAAGLTILQLVAFQGLAPAAENIQWPGVILFAGALILLRWKKVSPILTMVACGVVYLMLGLAMGLA